MEIDDLKDSLEKAQSELFSDAAEKGRGSSGSQVSESDKQMSEPRDSMARASESGTSEENAQSILRSKDVAPGSSSGAGRQSSSGAHASGTGVSSSGKSGGATTGDQPATTMPLQFASLSQLLENDSTTDVGDAKLIRNTIQRAEQLAYDQAEKLQKDLKKQKDKARKAEKERDELKKLLAGKDVKVRLEEEEKDAIDSKAKQAMTEAAANALKQEELGKALELEAQKKLERNLMLESQAKLIDQVLHDVQNSDVGMGYVTAERKLKELKEQSAMRLSMLGLRGPEESATFGEQTPLPGRNATLGAPVVTKKVIASKPLSSLQSIDEDFDDEMERSSEDLQEGWQASECSLSEGGDDYAGSAQSSEGRTRKGSSVWSSGMTDLALEAMNRTESMEEKQKLLLGKDSAQVTLLLLREELEAEKTNKSAKASLAVENEEQAVQIEILQEKLEQVELYEALQAEKKEEIKSELVGEILENSRQKLVTKKVKEVNATQVEEKANEVERITEDYQEQLNRAMETLRIANMRVQDLKHELEQTSRRHEREVQDLKEQLKYAKKNGAQSPADVIDQPDDQVEDVPHLKKVIKELREDISVLSNKLEALGTGNKIEVEELLLQQTAELKERDRKSAYKLDCLRQELNEQVKEEQRILEGEREPRPRAATPTPVTRRATASACMAGIQSLVAQVGDLILPGEEGEDEAEVPSFQIQDFCWALLSGTLDTVVLACNISDMTIAKVSLEAFSQLGAELAGQPLLSLLCRAEESTLVRRNIIQKRCEMKDCEWNPNGFCINPMGVFAMAGEKKITAKLVAVHTRPEPENHKDEGLFMILIPTKSETRRSRMSAQPQRRLGHEAFGGSEYDVTASDSISMVGKSQQAYGVSSSGSLQYPRMSG